MKKFILPFLFVLFFTLTSCSTQWTVATYSEPYPVQWVDVYDFNRIHWLYLNHPQWVWTNYYTHPLFIRYRSDCLRRGIYIEPYRPNRRFTSHRRNVVRNDRPIRYNSGRSNWNYNTRRQPTSRNYNFTQPQYKRNTTPSRVQRSTPTRSNYSRSSNTQMRSNRSSTPRQQVRSAPSRRSSGRNNGRVNH